MGFALPTKISGIDVTTSDRLNEYYFTEPPKRRLLKYCGTLYDIPFPYVHYHMQWYQQFEQWNFFAVYGSAQSLERNRRADYLPLPNSYLGRPCAHSQMYNPRNREDCFGLINEFWQGNFNRDGRLHQYPIWHWMRGQSEAGSFERRKVLSWWELQSVSDVLLWPWRRSFYLG